MVAYKGPEQLEKEKLGESLRHVYEPPQTFAFDLDTWMLMAALTSDLDHDLPTDGKTLNASALVAALYLHEGTKRSYRIDLFHEAFRILCEAAVRDSDTASLVAVGGFVRWVGTNAAPGTGVTKQMVEMALGVLWLLCGCHRSGVALDRLMDRTGNSVLAHWYDCLGIERKGTVDSLKRLTKLSRKMSNVTSRWSHFVAECPVGQAQRRQPRRL